MNTRALPTAPMSVDEFLAWSQDLPAGERYELVGGRLARMESERIIHAETKFSAVVALKSALKRAGRSDCHAFIDGVSVRIDETTLREPDALIHCGPYDPNALIAENPVVVVEVASPQSPESKKTLDYFSLASVEHYLVLFPAEGRVLHQFRSQTPGEIVSRILGRDATIELTPPGITIAVEALFAG
ncbi:Uma2 family endonuclease [Jiella pacifica]|mgnify:CR=1 FL=1|uniref:Uma2 family endonuclease n=1 Tax=Jiella pacifica TaxID=2696469 RepID=A0A6N9T578_9HYPH|nr:Uma2 family endonuclease [Jiella pacifica]NDW06544.1 Uma2 family endonuclease [Jiella pacifica]